MARFGEGDSRWIVEDRADGANVHNWHWSEKDCLPWAKERLGQIFDGCPVLDGQGGCHIRIVRLEQVDGEAYVNIRKGKIIPGYELSIRLRWEGEVRDLQGVPVASANGAVELPYVSEENHDEEPEVRVTVSDDSPPAQRLHQAMVAEGRPLVRKRIATFVKELRAGGPVKDELGRKGDGNQGGGGVSRNASGTSLAPVANAVPPETGGSTKSAATVAAVTVKKATRPDQEEKGKRSIAMTFRFHCRASDLYDVLLDEKRWMAFTHSKAQISREVGGSFSLFDGAVSGTNQKLEPYSLIVQKWRFSSWPDGIYSMVCMTIEEPEPGNTILKLTQTGIPEEDRFGNATVYDTTEKGWRELVFGRIRAVFGYGV